MRLNAADRFYMKRWLVERLAESAHGLSTQHLVDKSNYKLSNRQVISLLRECSEVTSHYNDFGRFTQLWWTLKAATR